VFYSVLQGFPVFSTVLLANHLFVKDSKEIVDSLTEEDISSILALSKDQRIADHDCLRFHYVYVHTLCV